MALKQEYLCFHRIELGQIHAVYGRGVAAGKFKDYAIDMWDDKACFSIFKNASEQPIYKIIKDPAFAKKQGIYRVVSQTGHIMKRGHDLEQVLKILDKFQTHLSLV